MPIYEYRCAACGHTLEALQKMTDSPLRKCPDCGKAQLRRLISAPVFRLKGSGWYETDFKSENEKKRNLVESGRDADSAGGAEKPAGEKKEAAADAAPAKEAQPAKPAAPKKAAVKAAKPKPAVKRPAAAPRKTAVRPKPARAARR